MSDNVLAGLLVGLFIGGIIGAMAMAVVATGSKQRFPRVVARRAGTADASGQARAGSSSRVDLLVDLDEVPRSTEMPVAEGDDTDQEMIDQEMRDLVRRYGRPTEH
jgi:hypothetical protein